MYAVGCSVLDGVYVPFKYPAHLTCLDTAETFSFDWIIKVNDKYIVGYNFDINSSAASAICNDKAATYEVLN